MKLGSNSVKDHPQLSHNRHPMDGALVGAGSLWPSFAGFFLNLTVYDQTQGSGAVFFLLYFTDNSI